MVTTNPRGMLRFSIYFPNFDLRQGLSTIMPFATLPRTHLRQQLSHWQVRKRPTYGRRKSKKNKQM